MLTRASLSEEFQLKPTPISAKDRPFIRSARTIALGTMGTLSAPRVTVRASGIDKRPVSLAFAFEHELSDDMVHKSPLLSTVSSLPGNGAASLPFGAADVLLWLRMADRARVRDASGPSKTQRLAQALQV
jgi:hypothetical protein